jgi:colicin import membrane protein
MDVEEARLQLMREQADAELARAEFERQQNEFLAAQQQADKECAEAQKAHSSMLDALAAYTAASADPLAEASHVAELQQRYLAAKAVYEREAAEAEDARRTAEQERAEAEEARALKEQEEHDVQQAAAALQREIEEASSAAHVFEQVFFMGSLITLNL